MSADGRTWEVVSVRNEAGQERWVSGPFRQADAEREAERFQRQRMDSRFRDEVRERRTAWWDPEPTAPVE